MTRGHDLLGGGKRNFLKVMYLSMLAAAQHHYLPVFHVEYHMTQHGRGAQLIEIDFPLRREFPGIIYYIYIYII